MKPRPASRLTSTLALISFTLVAGNAQAQTWANSNGTALPIIDWFTAGPNPDATWTGGAPVSGSGTVVQFLDGTAAGNALTNTAAAFQTSYLNYASAFQLGTLTLSGRGSGTSGAHFFQSITGSALNFSGLTGTINLNSVLGTANLAFQVGNNIHLGAASSASALTLTGGGTGAFFISGNISELQAGGGSLIKSGNSLVNLTGNNTYTGATSVTGGTLRLGSLNALPGGIGATGGTSALTLNGGILELGNNDFLRNLGSGASQFRIIGTTSGFSSKMGVRNLIVNNNAEQEIVWGSADFNPTTALVLNGVTADARLTLQNKIDLGNTTRTINSAGTLGDRSAAVISGIIRNSSGTAGLTKTGAGTLKLHGLNTFNGAVNISGGGTLSINTIANGGAGNSSSLGVSSNVASNLILNSGILRYTGAVASSDRLFSLQSSSSLEASGTGALNLNNIAAMGFNGGTAAKTLTLTGSNSGNNTLAALIGNNTGLTSIAKTGLGTWVLSGANTFTGAVTVSAGTLAVASMNTVANPNPLGQSSAAAVNLILQGGTLKYTTGGTASTDRNFALLSSSTIDASGAGPLNFTQTAAVSPDVTGLTFSATGSNKVLTGLSSTANLLVGMSVTGTGIAAGSTIASINSSSQVTLTSTSNVTLGTGVSATFGYGSRTLTLTGTNTGNNTMSGVLQNSATAGTTLSVSKAGQGTWVLNGPAVNTYTGGTNVNTGTLKLDFANLPTLTPTNLINSSSALTLGGGTLSLVGKVGAVSSQTFGNPTFGSQAGSGISITGESETNTMDLVLGNTWTRGSGSTLNVTLGTGGSLTSSPDVLNGLVVGRIDAATVGNVAFATVDSTDWATVTGGKIAAYSGYNTTFPSSGASATVNYSLTGTSSVASSETAYTLKINTSGSGQSLAITAGETLTLNGGGLLFTGADDYSITGGTLKGAGGNHKNLVVHQFGGGKLTIDSVITNGGLTPAASGLVTTGTGTVILSQANTHTGTTFAGGGGTLVLKHQDALKTSVLTVNNSNIVFDSSVTGNAFTLGGLSSPYAGPGYDIALQNNAGSPAAVALTVNQSGNLTYAGSLSGSGSLIKSGAGTLTLSGYNTYSGGTTINGGMLALGTYNDWALGGGGPNGNVQVTVNATGTLQLNANTMTGTMTLNGGTLAGNNSFASTWDGTINLQATSTFGGQYGTVYVPAVISGTGGLTKSNTSAFVLSNANTFSGDTRISAGMLVVAHPLALQNSTLDTTNSVAGGTAIGLRATVNTLTLGGLSGANNLSSRFTTDFGGSFNTNLNNLTVQTFATPLGGYSGLTALTLNPNASQAPSYSGVIEDGAPGMSLIKTGLGKQTLTNAHTYTGATVVSAGTLELGVSGTIANSSTITVGNAGSSGAVLDVSAKTGGFTIGSSQELNGIGTVDANDGATKYTVAINGIHAPGNSVGKQTIDGNLNYATSGSIFEWELGATLKDTSDGTRGIDYDAVNVSGTLAGTDAIFRVVLAGTTNFADTFWNSDRTWTDIFKTADAGTNVSFAAAFLASGFQYYNSSGAITNTNATRSFSISGSTLTWSAIPEPTSALAGLLLGAGLLRRRRN